MARPVLYSMGISHWCIAADRMLAFKDVAFDTKPVPYHDKTELIAATTTKTGLKVACELDTNQYPKGIKIKNAEMRALAIKGDSFHPEWNYTISPDPHRLNRAFISRRALSHRLQSAESAHSQLSFSSNRGRATPGIRKRFLACPNADPYSQTSPPLSALKPKPHRSVSC